MIIHPVVGNERANPVLFDRDVFPDLSSIEGDTGGRVILDKYSPRTIPWKDARIKADIDTMEDYQKLRSAGE
jgi:molybdenum cofactor cytidylyltransferase